MSQSNRGPTRSSPGDSLRPAGRVLAETEHPPTPHDEADAIFLDLKLDQWVAAVVLGREEYDLAGVFSEPLRNEAEILYRQEVCQDLERRDVRVAFDAFARWMREMHAHHRRSARYRYLYQKLAWYLEAAAAYGAAVTGLARDLGGAELASAGLGSLRGFLSGYVRSDGFLRFADEVASLRNRLAGVVYALAIRGSRITVQRYEGEADYAAQVERTFEKFRQASSKRYAFAFDSSGEMNHIEEQIFDRVVPLYPDVFADLREFGERRPEFPHPTIARLEREVQFYLAYLDAIAPLRAAAAPFCYPSFASDGHDIDIREGFDLVLAHGRNPSQRPLVPNDVSLSGAERVLVVTGPNQGGKTTFARMVGQLHYLGRLGLPVPARSARLVLCDRVFTHFERSEHPESQEGKLKEEVRRVHAILELATDRSLIVLNESFSSTSAQDAEFLGRQVLRELARRGSVAIYVTFLDELSRLGTATVSLVAAVAPDDPRVRTYRVVRARADGRAYAAAIASKYGLTYPQLKERLLR